MEEGRLPTPWQRATENKEAEQRPRPSQGGQAKEVPLETVKGNQGLKCEESYRGKPERLSVHAKGDLKGLSTKMDFSFKPGSCRYYEATSMSTEKK